MTPDFLRVLKGRHVAYDSSLMGFDHPYEVEGLVQLPVQWTVDDALYFRYTNSARDKTHPANPVDVLESWIEEFEGIREYGGLFMVTITTGSPAGRSGCACCASSSSTSRAMTTSGGYEPTSLRRGIATP